MSLEFVKVDRDADPYSIAHTIALNALVARAKSKGELAAHLKKRGIEDDVAAAVIFRLQESGLINDEEFAVAWTQSRHNSKKLSKRIIAGELRGKGVDQESIDAALDGIDDESEYRTAFSLAMRKYSTMSRLEPEVQVRRIQSLLQRKGFSFSVIGRVLQELGIEVARY
ncbi:MAG: recombination regulator RecX [Candidatus Planktophila sp.]|nr:recombination regulator RecX [Candidatus Planktophila sp.]